MNSLEKVLHKLEESELNLNAEKSFFGRTETEHLGLWVGNQGVRPLLTEIRKVFLFLFPPSLSLYYWTQISIYEWIQMRCII